MGRRRVEEPEKENHERWLITYSDLITLLLIYFVVLYSMSKIDIDKYKNFTESLTSVLKGTAYIFENSGPSILEGLSGKNVKGTNTDIGGTTKNRQMTEEEIINDIQKQVLSLIKEHGIEGKVLVIQEERGLSILLKDVLFNSGSAQLTPQAKEVVHEIAKILEKVPNNDIRIEGHTDNVPIHNKYFYSNWELSTARATTVLQEILRVSKVKPERFSVVGYGEYRPIASNKTPQGRALNRRVTIVILRTVYSKAEPAR
ncbi:MULTISPECIES: OmpA family protein [unclassified Caldicellulosiruptor]|uniref:OmpA family protein n=1 Tax=unclassified Caldicellulosiruptor TaxID=2622462 RepID=UPI00039B04C2|nr:MULTISPECIES: OmpA family protein [unclassified Caldicellulosiruptor]